MTTSLNTTTYITVRPATTDSSASTEASSSSLTSTLASSSSASSTIDKLFLPWVKEVYIMADGSEYTGQRVKGLPEGFGVMWYSPRYEPKNFYIGWFSGGLPNGYGTLTYSSKHTSGYDKIYGVWKDGILAGQGQIYWRDGSFYDGGIKDEKPHGKGTAYFYEGESKYREEAVEYAEGMKKTSSCICC